MAFAPLFDPTQQFMARSGAPLAGGLLYVYRNTSQSLATLKNVAGTTIANPVTLDADGRAAGGVFVSDASTYTLVVKDAFDATQWTIVSMSPLGGGSGGGSSVSITPTITSGTKIADYSIDGEAGELFTPNVTLSTLACVGGTCSINQSGQAQYDGSGSSTRWVMPHVMSVTTENIASSSDLKSIALTLRMAVSNGARQFVLIVTDDLPKFGFAKNIDNTFLVWTIYWSDGTTTTADGN